LTRVEFASYLAAGAVVGILAGLFGIGGGLVVVPTLVLQFSLKGLSPDTATHLAVGTSLACMIPTAISSILGHQRGKTLSWALFRQLAPAVMLGSALGALITVRLHASTLQALFGGAAIVFGLSLATGGYGKGSTALPRPPPSAWILRVGGAIIGCLSAVLGVGGGMMMVPFLSRMGVSIRQAVGTAAACVLPVALLATVTHILQAKYAGGCMGTGLFPLPAGLIYWPAFFGVTLMSTPCARLGAWLAHRCPLPVLRFLFIALLFGVGLTFLAGIYMPDTEPGYEVHR